MILRKPERILKSRRGFTLIEIMVALLIISLIGTSVSIAIFQIMKQSVTNRDYTTASQYTMNAIHWISRDAEMSQAIVTGEASGFPLTLSWVDWGSTRYQVVYAIQDGQLKRTYSVDGNELNQTILAQSVNTTSGNTSCEYDSQVLTLQVTATVGKGDYAVSVTNMRKIFMRSMP
jgi:prepilin-type N-terminal cleavage/methylation domain-containing protein